MTASAISRMDFRMFVLVFLGIRLYLERYPTTGQECPWQHQHEQATHRSSDNLTTVTGIGNHLKIGWASGDDKKGTNNSQLLLFSFDLRQKLPKRPNSNLCMSPVRVGVAMDTPGLWWDTSPSTA